jgi:hypothetical protein
MRAAVQDLLFDEPTAIRAGGWCETTRSAGYDRWPYFATDARRGTGILPGVVKPRIYRYLASDLPKLSLVNQVGCYIPLAAGGQTAKPAPATGGPAGGAPAAGSAEGCRPGASRGAAGHAPQLGAAGEIATKTQEQELRPALSCEPLPNHVLPLAHFVRSYLRRV